MIDIATLKASTPNKSLIFTALESFGFKYTPQLSLMDILTALKTNKKKHKNLPKKINKDFLTLLKIKFNNSKKIKHAAKSEKNPKDHL